MYNLSRLYISSIISVQRSFSNMANSGKLIGKVAVITASTQGIGFGIAKRLGLEGASVVISSRSEKNVSNALIELKKLNIKAYGIPCHVGNVEHRKQLLEEAAKINGKIDILVSNAAVNPIFGAILDTNEKAWDKIMDTNVKATFFLCKETIPYMEKTGGGNITIITSIAGYQPSAVLGAYSISKTSLIGMVKAFAPQLASKNIRINAIAPGLIKTNFSKAILQTSETRELLLSNNIPMNRIGTVEDIEGVAFFLASDDSKYITGETICATGGMPSRL